MVKIFKISYFWVFSFKWDFFDIYSNIKEYCRREGEKVVRIEGREELCVILFIEYKSYDNRKYIVGMVIYIRFI